MKQVGTFHGLPLFEDEALPSGGWMLHSATDVGTPKELHHFVGYDHENSTVIERHFTPRDLRDMLRFPFTPEGK